MNRESHLYSVDLIRILCAAAVVVYHVQPDLLPGGYLAVCVFLALHGYMFVYNAQRKEKFNLFGYWFRRFIRLYLPVVFTVCLTMIALKFLPEVIWLNKKPETLSVLYGSNNWWQIAADQSYFTRVTASPFTHMWYVSMILQIEVVLPLVYLFFRGIKKLFGQGTAAGLFMVLAVLSFYVMPYYMSLNYPAMRVYFGTDARAFSLLAGMAMGMLVRGKQRPGSWALKKGLHSDLLFLVFGAALGVLFFRCSQDSALYADSFILATLLACGLLLICGDPSYPVNRHLRFGILAFAGSLTYEVYLVHYPLLYLLRCVPSADEGYGKYAVWVLLVSLFTHLVFAVLFKKRKKGSWTGFWKKAVLVPYLAVTAFGGYEVIKAKDNTEEMARLKEQLEESARLQEESREEYLRKREEEFAFFNDPAAMAKDVGAHNLPVTCLGDSVMLGAYADLMNTFPHGDVDAAVNRAYYPILSLCERRAADGTLGNPVVINCGANGYVPMEIGERIINACGNRQVYWLTPTNRWQIDNRPVLFALDEEYDNMRVLDWENESAGHGDYFWGDGLHLTPKGRAAYAGFIFNEIVKDLISDKYADYDKERVMVIGDGFLMGALDELSEEFEDLYTIASGQPDINDAVGQIQSLKESGVLPQRAVIALGSQRDYSEQEFSSLLDALTGVQVYLVKLPLLSKNTTNDAIALLEERYPEVIFLSIETWQKEYPERISADRIHFTEEGENEFARMITEELSRESGSE